MRESATSARFRKTPETVQPASVNGTGREAGIEARISTNTSPPALFIERNNSHAFFDPGTASRGQRFRAH